LLLQVSAVLLTSVQSKKYVWYAVCKCGFYARIYVIKVGHTICLLSDGTHYFEHSALI
jgi:hypothetical protein